MMLCKATAAMKKRVVAGGCSRPEKMIPNAIVFSKACQAELIEGTIPEPGPGQVLVRLAVSTISSGMERANLVGDRNVSISRKASSVSVFPRPSERSPAMGQGIYSIIHQTRLPGPAGP